MHNGGALGCEYLQRRPACGASLQHTHVAYTHGHQHRRHAPHRRPACEWGSSEACVWPVSVPVFWLGLSWVGSGFGRVLPYVDCVDTVSMRQLLVYRSCIRVSRQQHAFFICVILQPRQALMLPDNNQQQSWLALNGACLSSSCPVAAYDSSTVCPQVSKPWVRGAGGQPAARPVRTRTGVTGECPGAWLHCTGCQEDQIRRTLRPSGRLHGFGVAHNLSVCA